MDPDNAETQVVQAEANEEHGHLKAKNALFLELSTDDHGHMTHENSACLSSAAPSARDQLLQPPLHP